MEVTNFNFQSFCRLHDSTRLVRTCDYTRPCTTAATQCLPSGAGWWIPPHSRAKRVIKGISSNSVLSSAALVLVLVLDVGNFAVVLILFYSILYYLPV